MNKTIFAFVALVALGMAATASAQPQPSAFSPAPNAVMAASPKAIRITFNETLVAAFSGIDVADKSGHKADLGPAVLDGAKTTLSAPVRTPLSAGTYTVTWRAVAADTHHVTSHYSFQIKP